jgi:hypothetical protein
MWVRPDKPIRASYACSQKKNSPGAAATERVLVELKLRGGGPSFANNTPGQIFGSKLFSESPTSPAKVNVWISAGGLSRASSLFRYGAAVMSYL